MDYLKPEQYYVDLYDLFTIKTCLRVISFWQKSYKESSKDKELKKLSKDDKEKGFNYYLTWELYGTKFALRGSKMTFNNQISFNPPRLSEAAQLQAI